MRKLLIIGVCIAGFVFLAADPCKEHPKSESTKWMKEAKVEVTNIENGAIVKMTSDNPEVVKKIQEWAVNKFGHKKAIEGAKKVEKVKDLVCGMEVEKEKALSAEYEGKTYYFCAQDCKDEFLKDPATYIGEKTQEGR